MAVFLPHTCKGFRSPGNFCLSICNLGNFACGIRNPTNDWNQESKIFTDKTIRNLWRGIRNSSMSWIPLRGASFQYRYLQGAFDARFSKGFKPPKAFNNQAYIFIYFQILSVELEEAQGESPFTRISSSAFPQRTPPLLDLVLSAFQQRHGHEVEQV